MTDKKSPADDLSVLNAERTKRIAGQSITCREYSFFEELELRQYSQPILDSFVALLTSGDDISHRDLDLLLASNVAAVIKLISISSGRDETFLRSLNQRDGEALRNLWWDATSPFFIRCATEYALGKIQSVAQRKMVAGQISTPPSSPTDTTLLQSDDIPIDK